MYIIETAFEVVDQPTEAVIKGIRLYSSVEWALIKNAAGSVRSAAGSILFEGQK